MALEAARRKYKPYACIERSYSLDKKKMFKTLGGTLIDQIDGLSAFESIQEWIADNEEIRPVYLNQFNNSANLEAHKKGTAAEIVEQLDLYD